VSQKELGYVELRWTCPRCSHVNPGTTRTCEQCGAPQPDKVTFEQGAGSELRTDDVIKKAAQAGPDIHCPYCGTRNPGDAKTCSQCGGDLSEGVHRQAGTVVGAYQAGPVGSIACPRCGSDNPASNANCQKCGAALKPETNPTPVQSPNVPSAKKPFPVWLIAIIAVACIAGAALLFFMLRTDSVTGIIQQAQWERTVPIEALMPVEYSVWQDQIPSGAVQGSCTKELREEVSSPVPGAVEVCGTPYTVDTGGGVGKVVQDCLYQVYDQLCKYTVQEWQVIDSVTSSGDLQQEPSWPEPNLLTGQRASSSLQETYTIIFVSDGKVYTYRTSSNDLFRQAEIGDEWTLEINGLGAIVNAQP
jgi:hypothetical protein